ncbi:MAG: class I SAM-dependent methyltransferase [Gammaproteobacteria bacterium]
MNRHNPQEWSPFWQTPTITSFGNLFPDNYDDSILEFWESQLNGHPGRVADLACGNGALTWICDRILNEKELRAEVMGVDFANIDPFRVLGRNPADYPGITFVGGTPVESFPFEDNSIDVVVSQYGIEYSDLSRTIPEAARVLTPRGKISLIMHDARSVLIEGAVEHLEDFRQVLNTIRMHDLALELDALHDIFDSEETLAAAKEFHDVMRRIRAAAGEVESILKSHPAGSPLRAYVTRLNEAFSGRTGFRSTRRKTLIVQARDRLHAHIARIDDLRDAALDETDRRQLGSLLREQGLKVVEERVLAYKQQPNIGTVLVAVNGRD